MRTLIEIQNGLKEALLEGIDVAFKAIKAQLTPGTDQFNDLVLIEARYLDISRQLLLRVLSDEAAQLEFNKVRKDIMDYIDTIQDSHLLQSTGETPKDDRPDIYNGEVFYRIPKQMQMQQWVKCIVRLAFDRKILTDGLEVEDQDVLKDLRISEVMGVELMNDMEEAFEINTKHDTVQTVDKDLFTEWVFNVRPIMEGTHPLVLRISIIEIKDGIERKRNVVLEEQVVVVTEAVPEEGVEEKRAAAVHVGGVMAQPSVPGGGGKSVAPQPSAPSPAPKSGKRAFPMVGKAMAALAVIVIASMVVWNNMQSPTIVEPGGGDVAVIDPPDVDDGEQASVPPPPDPTQKDWDLAQATNTRAGYEEFLKNNPASSYVDAAMMELASIEAATYEAATTVAALEAYLKEYPDGIYVAAARTRIKELKDLNRRPPRRNEPQPANPGRTNNTPNSTGTTEPRPRPTPRDETPVEDENTVVPMRQASRKPIYDGCTNDDNPEKEERCTKDKIYRFLKSKLKYPSEAKHRNIEGTVMVEFTIEKDGSITDVQYTTDPGGGTAQEAVRLVQAFPKFKPGKDRAGNPIRVRYKQPITFRLR